MYDTTFDFCTVAYDLLSASTAGDMHYVTKEAGDRWKTLNLQVVVFMSETVVKLVLQ